MEIRTSYHKKAVRYYEHKISLPNYSPIDKGEYISHIGYTLQYDKFQEFRAVYYDELRPVAYRLFKDRKYKEAIECFKILENLYPEDINIKFQIGLCYANLQEWALAEPCIEKAIGLDERAWWILAGYGEILAKKRVLESAEKYLNQALEIADVIGISKWRYSAIYQAIGLVYEKRKDVHKAEYYYTKAIDYDNQSAFARYAYAKFLWHQDDTPTALEQLYIAKKLDSSLEQINKLINTIAKHTDFHESEDTIEPIYEDEDLNEGTA